MDMKTRIIAIAAVIALLSACGSAAATVDDTTDASAVSTTATGLFDESTVHEISIDVNEAEYSAMLQTYLTTDDKDWVEASVTIDGVTYDSVGIRLKGNSSLRGIDESAEAETLPWLVDLDQYVEGQSHHGIVEFVVRSNSTTTALNEAVALDLLEAAGLESQDAVSVAFTVNDSAPVLRLVIENPDDVWMTEEFSTDGALYKAEADGDYSYRGDDPESYDDVFDQEAGDDNADLEPLIDFLAFVNDSDDTTFAAELAEHLDIDSFATYLAMQEIIDNFDDIDGPGNNSYLYLDTETGVFEVVFWDANLAFGVTPGGAGEEQGFGPGGGEGLEPPTDRPDESPTDGERPASGELPEGGGAFPEGGALPGGSNVLAARFREHFAGLVDQKLEELTAELVESGQAESILDERVAVVEASGLVEASDIEADAARITQSLTS